MNEVTLIRCGMTTEGKSLYLVTVDGKDLTPRLTLAETIGALRMVKDAEAELKEGGS